MANDMSVLMPLRAFLLLDPRVMRLVLSLVLWTAAMAREGSRPWQDQAGLGGQTLLPSRCVHVLLVRVGRSQEGER